MRRVKTRSCPRCGNDIGEFPGALSRVDNKTEICSDCGSREAIGRLFGDDLTGYGSWVNPPNKFLDDVEDLLKAETLAVKTCDHLEWRWLDCEECRETIGSCGEKVCVACGEDV